MAVTGAFTAVSSLHLPGVRLGAPCLTHVPRLWLPAALSDQGNQNSSLLIVQNSPFIQQMFWVTIPCQVFPRHCAHGCEQT